MILHSLKFRGIGQPFKSEVSTDFDALPEGLVALVGGNGAGKSHVLALSGPGTTFRELRDYEEPVSAHVIDGVRDAFSELEFSVGGERYRALLQIDPQAAGGRGRQEAYLMRRTGEDEWTPLAGPGVKEYDAAIRAILPPPELFYASVFAAQGGGGSFFGMPKAARKDMFVALLGLDHLGEMAQRCKITAGVFAGDLAAVRRDRPVLEQQREARMMLEDEVAHLDGRLADQKRAAAELAEKAKAAQGGLDEARTAYVRAEAEAAEAQRTAERLLGEKKAAEGMVVLRKQAVLDIQAMAGRAEAVRRAVKDTGVLEREIAEEQERGRLAREALAEAQQKAIAINARVGDLRVRHGEVKGKLEEVRRSHADTQARFDDLGRRAGLLESIPGVPECSTCPLTEEARAAAEERGTVANRILALNLGHWEGEYGGELADIQRQGEEEKAKLEALRLDTEAHAAASRASAEKVTLAEKRKAELASLVGRQAEVAAVDARLVDATAALAEAENAAQRAAQAADGVAVPDLLPLSAALGEAERKQRAADTMLAAVQASLRQVETTLADRRGRLETLGDPTARLAEIDAQEAALVVELSDWLLLERTLGRDGVQALAIDAAGPGVTSIANDLLATCYGPRFSISLETTAEKKDGGQREVFDCRILDAEAGREAKKLSGGETAIVDFVLRVSLAIYNAGRSGIPLRTLWLDEVVGPLSPENCDRFIVALRRAIEIGGFQRALLIAHQPEVYDQADARLFICDGTVGVS
jgi:DNA repair protein SbcC/Rad50